MLTRSACVCEFIGSHVELFVWVEESSLVARASRFRPTIVQIPAKKAAHKLSLMLV